MKIKKDFILNQIGDTYVAMATGAELVSFNALISTNEVGAFIWNKLLSENSAENVAEELCAEYGIDQKTALADTMEFMDSLKSAGIAE